MGISCVCWHSNFARAIHVLYNSGLGRLSLPRQLDEHYQRRLLSPPVSPQNPNINPKKEHQFNGEHVEANTEPRQNNGLQIPEQHSADVSHSCSQELLQTGSVVTGSCVATGCVASLRYSSYWARIRSNWPVVKRTRHRLSPAYDM